MDRLAGFLAGTFTNLSTKAQQTVNMTNATAPVTNVDPSCSILDLTLGPPNLNLLGLVVTLNQVHLTVAAV